MTRRLLRSGLLLLAVMVAIPLSGGCTTAPPEEMEIRIGVIGGLTGPAPADVNALVDELEHIFGYMNEVEGGIDGVKLNWKIVDNRGTPDGALLAYKELRDNFDPLLYYAVEDYYLLGAKADMEADEVVVFTSSAIDPRSFQPPGRMFGLPIATSDGFAGFVKWVLEDHQGSGKPRIGVLYWGDLASGQQWRMAESWVRKQGVELELVEYPIRTMDLKPQLIRLREADVDFIWMLGVAGNAALAIRDFHGLGLTGQIPLCFMEYVTADQLLELVGPGAEGFYVYRSETPYSDGTEAAELYTRIWEWATGEEKWSDNRMLLTLKAAMTAAVRAAVAEVGWENLDSAAIYDALNGLTSIDTLGNTGDFGFGPNRRLGVSTIKMAQFTADGTVSVSDFITLPRTFEGIDK